MEAQGCMDINFWAATDTGRVREINEDNFLIDKELKLSIVCDGMGGHAAGEIASSMACQVTREVLLGHSDIIQRYREHPNASLRKDILMLLEFAVRDACARIFQRAQESNAHRGMGTTLSLLLLCGRRGFVAHVGDSRVYLLRKDQAHQLTEDHSLVNELRKRGKLGNTSLDKLPFKNAVTRAVGVYETVEVDTLDFDLLPGDRFLICSDGLHNYFTNDEVPAELSEIRKPTLLPKACIDFANRRGGRDNITAILVGVKEAEEDGHTRRVQRATQLVRGLPLFQGLTLSELAKVMNILQQRPLEQDEDPFSEGADGLLIVLAGTVGVFTQGAQVDTLRPGQAFGMLALIDAQRPEPAIRYRGLEPSSLFVIPRDGLLALAREEGALGGKVLWNLSRLLTAQLRQYASAAAGVGQLQPLAATAAAGPPPLPSLQTSASPLVMSAMQAAPSPERTTIDRPATSPPFQPQHPQAQLPPSPTPHDLLTRPPTQPSAALPPAAPPLPSKPTPPAGTPILTTRPPTPSGARTPSARDLPPLAPPPATSPPSPRPGSAPMMRLPTPPKGQPSLRPPASKQVSAARPSTPSGASIPASPSQHAVSPGAGTSALLARLQKDTPQAPQAPTAPAAPASSPALPTATAPATPASSPALPTPTASAAPAAEPERASERSARDADNRAAHNNRFMSSRQSGGRQALHQPAASTRPVKRKPFSRRPTPAPASSSSTGDDPADR
jgi:PPM family protein phosphatase